MFVECRRVVVGYHRVSGVVFRKCRNFQHPLLSVTLLLPLTALLSIGHGLLPFGLPLSIVIGVDCFVTLYLFVPLLLSSEEEYYTTDDYATQ